MTTFRTGQTWRTRNGDTCKIVLVMSSTIADFPIISDLYEYHAYRPDGTSCLSREGIDHEDDLIKLLSDLD